MKIASSRSGISQSMDLFIIIAAVLAVGGVVTASIYGLAGSASSNASIQVVQASAQGGSASGSTGIGLVSITIKNTGSSPLSGTMMVTLGGSEDQAISPYQTVQAVTATGSNGATAGTWSTQTGAANAVGTLTGTGVALPAGAQVAIYVGPVGTTPAISTLATGWNVGNSYQITVTFGGAQAVVTVTA